MPFEAARIARTGRITLNGPVSEVFPLFGPIKESAWAPGWAPKIIYLTGDLIEEHMVFTTTSHHGQEPDSTWTVSRYQPERAFVEYTVFAPERLWWITIQCRAAAQDKRTEAEVTYCYTGLTERGNLINQKALEKMFAHDLKDWEEEINFYLKTGRRVERPMVEIIPYQSTWPTEFREIASRLRQGLGSLALRIDHIGSTSVPDLAAKDVIDVQITVAALDQALLSGMLALGYLQPEGVWFDHHPTSVERVEAEWSKWFFFPPPWQRLTHTHVRVQGRANQRYPLLFRDYLRAHPATAEAYAELKRRLAQQLADPETYPVVKDPAVDLIYLAAEEWAAVTHWQPGPSDA